MKSLLVAVLMVLIAAAQVSGEENDPKEDTDYWTSTNQIQNGWISDNPFREALLRLTRKPKPHQFIGLMGRRSMGHKVNSFVGLMGKRSQEEPAESYNWNTIEMYDKRR
ncbi:protachykinin-like isoform X3 [Simochromis diagramma]|uniref:protachykinin-1 isoform X3 n=1 Tax=Haplochromis burtoni TaxID=8153 RepID=UPI0003BC87AC|nr:protachykinin-1 isoform X3 [Haplochromis burtoni]XP_039858547.1 protachykinin-like isoform X3 [Simochromis diagramma]XP_039858665.1 protachykinin-like isoform X3 [Simochromis diagramma]